MSKVITFSRQFPAYHPKKGQPTFFVEKIWQSFGINPLFPSPSLSIHNTHLPYDIVHLVGDDLVYLHEYVPKHHTIRAGNRWKVGDKFSPRVWSGKPYNSKQIIIAPDIEIKKVWEFEIKAVKQKNSAVVYVDNRMFAPISCDNLHINTAFYDDLKTLCKNDGLTVNSFADWFRLPSDFKGQIICWNENIEY